MNITALDAC